MKLSTITKGEAIFTFSSGEPLLYLTDEQAEKLRKAGFLKCELP
jgi:hypothetical protein